MLTRGRSMEFRILGPLEVSEAGREVAVGGGKQRVVLALLLLHPNEVLSKDRLIDVLWGESPPPTAAKMLHNYVSQLRRALGGNGSPAALETRGNGYLLRLDRGERDVDRFEELLSRGRALGTDDPRAAADLLREALALWRGPPLADFTYEEFARVEIGRLEELRLSALEDRIDADLALGRHADLVAELRRLVGEHPLRERLRAQLMLALYRSGRRAEALEVYQDARRALLEERGLEPGGALRELEAGILREDPKLGAPSGFGAPLLRRRKRGLLIAVGGAALLAAAAVAAIFALSDRDDPSSAAALPGATCSPVVAASRATHDMLVAADLPLSGIDRSLGAEMDAAIRYVLREHGFRAGPYSVGYQTCNEATDRGGVADQRRCERNAAAYADTPSVVVVIGTFSSPCARFEIPITNHAGLAMISPSATSVGLTSDGPGAEPGEPDRLYPTGERTFARIVADDNVQAAANGLLARRLGIRRLFLLEGSPAPYSEGLVNGVDHAAERLGVRVVGRARWDPAARRFPALVERVREAHPDGVFLGGALIENEGHLIGELRAALPRARLLAPDGFSATDALVDVAGSAAEGMTVTISGTPPEALGPQGRRFVAGFSEDLGVTPETYSVYAAQAAEVVLDAVARSDGTRASVVRELFRTHVQDGIVGDFSITAKGDTTARTISAYRIEGGRQELLTVLTPGRELVPGSAAAR
jgi:DNA-binding SARP family transcriptional activator/ABC-type branched-subunit amino acid transport system substrate-binding protein